MSDLPPSQPGSAEAVLRGLFGAAVAAALPSNTLADHLPPPPRGRTIVIGAGKAAASMAQAVEAVWDGPLGGLVITRYGHGAACDRVEVVEAAHPVVDAAGLEATSALLRQLEGLTADDLVLCLLSGGGSALLAAPAAGVTLEDKQAVARALLRSGATIGEINCVRKHLSAVKGGRLAALAAPAQIVTLAISDAPGDDPSVLASGPTVPDPTTREQALAILDRHARQAPAGVRARLLDPASETPKPDPSQAPDFRLVATPGRSLAAAARFASELGYAPLVLGEIEGEAREVAKAHAALVRNILAGRGPLSPPCVILSGGETTVTVRGSGRGGRNAEYALALAVELKGTPGVHSMAADTDGIDGSEDNAGAMFGPDLLARARALGISVEERLADNDAWGVFAELDALLMTGPTLTNVNDLRAILIDPRPSEDLP